MNCSGCSAVHGVNILLAGDLLPALRFLGGLHNFCNFVIIFYLMKVMIICRSSDIFYRFGNHRILPKNAAEIEVYEN